jgi:hypothetical protein
LAYLLARDMGSSFVLFGVSDWVRRKPCPNQGKIARDFIVLEGFSC